MLDAKGKNEKRGERIYCKICEKIRTEGVGVSLREGTALSKKDPDRCSESVSANSAYCDFFSTAFPRIDCCLTQDPTWLVRNKQHYPCAILR